MKKLFTILFLISNIFFFSLSLCSQTYKLTLSESIELAADSSLEAFRVKNLYLASYWNYRAFRAERLPSLTFKTTPITFNRTIDKRYDSERGMDVYVPIQSVQSWGSLSLSQNIDFTGGTFYVDTDLGFMRNFGENTYSQFTSNPVRIGYYQPLFGFNEFKWEKKIEPLKYEKARRDFLYNRETISGTVIEYFFNLAMAQTEYDMALENAASADTLYRIGQERYKIASVSQSDLLTLKLDVVNARNTLKNAEISLKRSMFSFASFLNLDQEAQIELTLPESPKNLFVPIDQAVQFSKENNPDYLGFEQELLEAERDVDQAVKASNFEASVSVDVGFNQVAPQIRDVYRDLMHREVVGVDLKIPLVDWGVRKGRARMAQNNLNVSRISIEQKRVALEQEVIMTVSDFNIQQDLMMSAEEAMDLANSAYNMTKQRFIIGKSDINSLTLSLSRQKEAQKNYILALKEYWLSYYKIRKLTLYDFEEQKPLTFLFDEKMNLR